MKVQLRNLTLRGKALATVMASLLAIPAFMNSGASNAAGTNLPQSAVPAYFSDQPSWDRLALADRAPSFVVANPASGPGSAKAPWIASVFQTAMTGGLTLIGYSSTRYGDRPIQEVLDEISHYRTWYGINRIFLDETPYLCDRLSYYQTISETVHRNGGTVVLNPGMNPESCWAGVAEVIVNFEGSAATYETWTPAPWTLNSTNTSFWHIIYAAGLFDGTALLEMAAQRKATWAYLTDDVLPNPFDRLPGDQLWKSHRLEADQPIQSGITDTPIVLAAAPTATPALTAPPSEVTPPSATPSTVPSATVPTPADQLGDHLGQVVAPMQVVAVPSAPTSTEPPTTTAPTPTEPPTTIAANNPGPATPTAGAPGTVFGADSVGPQVPTSVPVTVPAKLALTSPKAAPVGPKSAAKPARSRTKPAPKAVSASKPAKLPKTRWPAPKAVAGRRISR